MSSTSDKQFIYVFDPLCSWCYAFGEKTLKPLIGKYGEQIPFEVISGGLHIGDRVGLLENVSLNYEQSLEQVSRTTGVDFGQEFRNRVLMNPHEFEMNSEYPSAAFAWLKQHVPGRQAEIAERIQRCFFEDGKSLGDAETYRELVKDLGLNFEPFKSIFYNPDSLGLAHQHFATVYKMGIRSFPALIYVHDRHGELLAQGYREFSQIEKNLQEIFYRV